MSRRDVVNGTLSLSITPQYAAIYARVSTEDQGKGFSISTQIEACQKLAEREGYTVPETSVLVDEGISGTTMDRPNLRKLRDLVNTRAITAAIVYDPDRLSRNLGHQLLLAEEFERAGVKLLIVSHPMEQGPEGWLFFQMWGALAEYERAKILERTRRGTVGRIQAGHPWGGRVPLGSRYVGEPHGGSFEIEEQEAALVRRIYAMCLGGMSLRAIARQLTAEGLPTPLERRAVDRAWRRFPAGTWQPTTVRALLTSEAYTGRAAWGKRQNLPHSTRRRRTPESEWISLAIPPIIDAATFQAAKIVLARHKQTATRNRKHDYLFVGARLRCGRCSRGMTGVSRHPGYWYYRCNSRYNITDRALRCSGSVRADVVEQRVWAAIVRVLEQPELIAAEVRRQEASADEQRAEIRRQLELIEAALAKCDREARRWADAYAQEVINVAELKGYRAEIVARRQSLQAEYASGQGKLDAIGQAVQQAELLSDYCARVHQQLHTFDHVEKRLAFEALDIRVSWILGQPLQIEGRIPIDEIVNKPLWRTDDRLRDLAVLPIANGYLVFYSRFSADREWSDPHAWAVACAFTSNFHTFAHDRDVTPKGFASPGDVVFWGGRWVLPYQSYPAHPTHLCFSESHDLHTWHAPTCFLGEANALPWNTRRRAIDPTLVVDGDVLHCFFVGSGATGTPGQHANMVGHAVSIDPSLQRWHVITRDAPLIGRSQAVDNDAGTNNVTVFRAGDGWTLIYSEGVANQHLAWGRSPDLLRWEFKGALPLPAQRWMSRKHGAPFVWREGDGYVMMLTGTDAADWTTFGLLTSHDGVHWALLPEQSHCRDMRGEGGQGHQQPPNTALHLTASSVRSAPVSGSG